jgi:hypothetical protein
MFNVQPSNFTPGFRVGFDDGELGFNVAEPSSFHEVAPSPSATLDLAANPYWRVAQSTPLPMRLAGAGMQPQAAVNTSGEELCRLFGRSGPLCLYMCADGRMEYTPNYPSGPCPPFWIRGIGSFPWGQ